jgi:hypothetical protein
VVYSRVKCLPTVKRVPDELWDEIRLIPPSENLAKTIGRPIGEKLIVFFNIEIESRYQ